MRPIKFRGKGKKYGKWYFGNLWDEDTHGVTHICTINSGFIKIDPNTVGQFTGLYDKKGNEIYEGDILRIGNFANVVCEFRHGAFGYIYSKDFHSFAGNTNYTFNPKNTDEDFEIIGNIYDNSELLKRGEKC